MCSKRILRLQVQAQTILKLCATERDIRSLGIVHTTEHERGAVRTSRIGHDGIFETEGLGYEANGEASSEVVFYLGLNTVPASKTIAS